MAPGQRKCKTIHQTEGKKNPVDFWPLWALNKAVILPFQGNSSPHNIRQQTECLLHEYKLNDKTLQKAQLEQHKKNKIKYFRTFLLILPWLLQMLLLCQWAQIQKSLLC